MYYLSTCIRGLLKLIFICFDFAIKKIFQILWKIFSIPSLYILEKKIPVSKYKKQMCYKENKSLFSWHNEKWAKFYLQKFFILNVIPDSLLVELVEK